MHDLMSCAHLVVQLAVTEKMTYSNNEAIGWMEHFYQYRGESEGARVIVVPCDLKMMIAEHLG